MNILLACLLIYKWRSLQELIPNFIIFFVLIRLFTLKTQKSFLVLLCAKLVIIFFLSHNHRLYLTKIMWLTAI